MDRKAWRAQVIEEALEPALPIIDAHHHIWATAPVEPWEPYDASALIADKGGAGHNVVATVYVDSHANYRTNGPQEYRVVGETEFAEGIAEEGLALGGTAKGICAGIVAHADLMLGSAVGPVLDAHIEASKRFRGIRFMTAIDPDLPPVYGATVPGLMMEQRFREGFAELARRGLSFDAWLFQPQLPELISLVEDFPEANIILDHIGGPIGIGRYADRRADAFAQWKRDMTRLAAHPNVSVKLGALNMSFTGMDAVDLPRPHTSQETADLQRNHILTAIDLFGPARCMFESNFPVDMRSISYTLLWNSFKRITIDLGADERADLFVNTAKRVYRLDDVVIG
jgi:predicted TIM-barrel fold metal-dependent hydrolase